MHVKEVNKSLYKTNTTLTMKNVFPYLKQLDENFKSKSNRDHSRISDDQKFLFKTPPHQVVCF